MMENEIKVSSVIDRLPTASLLDRYGIGKTALYDRFKIIGIKPIKESNKSYVTQEQLMKLDAVDEHLKRGGSLSDFALVKSHGSRNNLAKVTQQILTLTNNPFCDLEMLQNLADRQWLIDSKRLAIILNTSPRTLNRTDNYYYCGFVCSKKGKQGGRNVWQIAKLKNRK